VVARYFAKRVLGALFVLWLAVTLAFAALRLTPGDPAQALLAASGATADEIAARRAQLGLDDPLLAQYLRYLSELARGDLGESWLHGRSVGRMIAEQLPPTVALALAATAVGVTLGLLLGLPAALRQGTWIDTVTTSISAVGLSTPTYWSGLLAILLFSLTLHWLPSAGEGTVWHLVLPAAVLGLALSGSIARVVRAQVAEVLRAPFVIGVRARGLTPRRILSVHVLRNALGPALAVAALQFGFLLSGAVVTESVFARRGLGKLTVQAITWQDLPVLRGVMVVAALAFVLTSLAADLARGWLDPRLREGAQ
jgi:ABC-type dipeptide/oligopeptide/nickel transport system permease component